MSEAVSSFPTMSTVDFNSADPASFCLHHPVMSNQEFRRHFLRDGTLFRSVTQNFPDDVLSFHASQGRGTFRGTSCRRSKELRLAGF